VLLPGYCHWGQRRVFCLRLKDSVACMVLDARIQPGWIDASQREALAWPRWAEAQPFALTLSRVLEINNDLTSLPTRGIRTPLGPGQDITWLAAGLPLWAGPLSNIPNTAKGQGASLEPAA